MLGILCLNTIYYDIINSMYDTIYYDILNSMYISYTKHMLYKYNILWHNILNVCCTYAVLNICCINITYYDIIYDV